MGQTSQTDSLKALLETFGEDTSRVNTLIAICKQEYGSAPADAISYGLEALEISERLDYYKGMALANKFIGLGYYFQGDYWKTISHWQRSLNSFEAIGDHTGISNILNNIGAVYNNAGDDTRALEYYMKSLQAAEQTNDTLRILTAKGNIGSLYLKDDSTHYRAKAYLMDALSIIESWEDLDAEIRVNLNLGDIFYGQGKLDSALHCYERALEASRLSDGEVIPYAMTSMGKVYMQRKDFNKAIEIQTEAYEIAKRSDAKLEMMSSLFGLAETYVRQGDIPSAISTYKSAVKIAEEFGARHELRTAYHGLSESYADISDYRNAYHYLSLKQEIDTSLLRISEERTTELMNFSNNIILEEKEAAIRILEKQSIIEQLKSKRQRAIIITVGAVGIFLLILATRFYQQTQHIRRINIKIRTQRDEIEAQRDEIEAQRDEIEAQRDEVEAQRDEVEAQRDQLEIQRDLVVDQKNEIIDSISYAKRIQYAMLPPDMYVSELLNENFIFHRPRDIVSGDFYWVRQVKEFIVVLAADCTGHGVPGALMSMLGISFLNEIVLRREITQANQILNELRKQIKFSLRQQGQPGEAKDGMDIALCVMDLRNMVMQFSGANNPLYLIRDVEDVPELKEIKGDKMPVGYYQGKDKTFVNHEIQLEIGDTFYIFSDGFVDQKGGTENKKFLSKNFKKMLLEIHDQAMHEQKDILDKTFSDWMGKNDQLDDVLVIGVRV
jgi:serine phosphatase RsbU (regulator of sigma subunit)/Tfp pilus assembly protein PilF